IGPPAAPPGSRMAQQLSESERDDSGIGLEWAWANAQFGYSTVNLGLLNSSSLGLQNTSAGGPMWSVGAGARLLFLTVGARLRNQVLSTFNVWQIDAEAGFHLRYWRLDPYVTLRGGYAFLTHMTSSMLGGQDPSSLSMRGFNIGTAIGVDYYLNRLFSVGFEVAADLLYFRRARVDIPASVQDPSVPPYNGSPYTGSGSSLGMGVSTGIHAGLHF
ncbi:MAG: hypothetical protein WCI05_16705, partial [Myxococcales bacterium]